MSKILVTGGTGYVGTHTIVELLNADHEVVVYDNLSNSSEKSLDRVMKITGKKITFVKGDLRDTDTLNILFSNNKFNAVMHFAGLKSVPVSITKPLEYYDNNVNGSLQLFKTMMRYGVKTIVFSSSCTVYGQPLKLPLYENTPLGVPTSPYGMSKQIIEKLLNDLYEINNDWSIARLRYFNPVGAHTSGLIGEDPSGIAINLMPYITQTVIGKLKTLKVFGSDYPTPDGTAMRDYVHVMDVAKGHIAALNKINQSPGIITVNLGTGTAFSVFQVIRAFEKVNDVKINYEIVDRRPGDVPSLYADISFAKEKLEWKAQFGIDDMCRDSWNFQTKNPSGF